MTIAIGVLCSDGLVLAADREEGDGYLKNDTGKIYHMARFVPSLAWLSVTGAGDAAALDEISKLLSDTFTERDEERTSDEEQEALVRRHRSYYREVILPFSKQPSNERPDYSLIIGTVRQRGLGAKLFTTSKLAWNVSQDYAAVGIGASIANMWLQRLYERMPAISAIRLASYVVYQVKSSVSGCGFSTDVVMLRGKNVIEKVNPELIRRWEGVFRYFPSLERNIFSYCAGVRPSEILLRTKPDLENINKGIENLREALKLDDAEKFDLGLEDETKPSASQTSKDSQ